MPTFFRAYLSCHARSDVTISAVLCGCRFGNFQVRRGISQLVPLVGINSYFLLDCQGSTLSLHTKLFVTLLANSYLEVTTERERYQQETIERYFALRSHCPGEQTVAAVRRCRNGAIALTSHPCVYPFTGTQGWIARERSNHGPRHQAAPPAFTFFPTPVGETEWSASGSRLRPYGSRSSAVS